MSMGLGDQEGYFLEGKLEGQTINFLVDTGSSYSIISEELYNLLPNDKRPKLTPVERKISIASGADMPTKGWGNFEITVVGEVFEHPFVVATALDPALVGRDILQKVQGSLTFPNYDLTVKGVTFPLFYNTPANCLRVHTAHRRDIPAQYKARV